MISAQGNWTEHSQAYIVQFQSWKIFLPSRLPLYTLNHFHRTSTQKLKTTSISVTPDNNKLLLNGEPRFDLSHLTSLDLSNIDYILISEYEDLATVPFLTRNLNKIEGKVTHVLITQAALELAKLYINQLLLQINEWARVVPNVFGKQAYNEQLDKYGLLEQTYGVKPQEWLPLYSKSDFQNMLDRNVLPLNYAQIHQRYGLEITPYSAGKRVGSAIWLIESLSTKQNILFCKAVCTENWRHCLALQSKKLVLKGKPIQNLLLGNNCVLEPQHRDLTESLKTILKGVEEGLSSGRSCQIVVDDIVDVLDFGDILNYKMKSQFRQVFVQDTLFENMMKYANTYVQYLNPFLHNRIYVTITTESTAKQLTQQQRQAKDTPEYPFNSFQEMSKTGFISYGTLEQAARAHQLSLGVLANRFSPAIYFVSKKMLLLNPYKIQGGQAFVPDPNLICFEYSSITASQDQLQDWFRSLNAQKVFSFQKITGTKHLEKHLLNYIDEADQIYVKMRPPNLIQGKRLHKAVLAGHSVSVTQLNTKGVNQSVDEYVVIPKDWVKKLLNWVELQGYEGCITNQSTFQTPRSKVYLNQYTITLESTDLEEAKMLYQGICTFSKVVSLY